MAKRVLVIDDDHEFVDAMVNVLDAKGYEVEHAPNGKVGIAKAREQRPDIVLLDVMMTTKSEGLEVAREMNKDPKLKTVPIILITGVRKEMSLPFGFEPDEMWLPVKGVLEKPVKPDVLLKTIEEHINV
jgi:CheY-like chemotaxis protein